MPSYDATECNPPAPVAEASLRNGRMLADVLLLVDTGADVTLLPRHAVDRLQHSQALGMTGLQMPGPATGRWRDRDQRYADPNSIARRHAATWPR